MPETLGSNLEITISHRDCVTACVIFIIGNTHCIYINNFPLFLNFTKKMPKHQEIKKTLSFCHRIFLPSIFLQLHKRRMYVWYFWLWFLIMKNMNRRGINFEENVNWVKLSVNQGTFNQKNISKKYYFHKQLFAGFSQNKCS